MSSIMADQVPFNFHALVEANEVDYDISVMFSFDDIFTEVISSFEPVASAPGLPGLLQGPATSALDTPDPSSTMSHFSHPVSYVPVSPTSSCNDLNDVSVFIADAAEPTKISDMSFTPPSCVSPVPSTGDYPIEPRRKRAGDYSIQPLKKAKKAEVANTSATKRRRHSTCDSQGSVDSETIEEQKRQRNRDHARKSRLRKKSLTGSLQSSLEELKAENARLREQIYAAIGKNKTDLMVQSRLATSTEKFVFALKKPENKVLDAHALSFLQGLREEVLPKTTTSTNC